MAAPNNQQQSFLPHPRHNWKVKATSPNHYGYNLFIRILFFSLKNSYFSLPSIPLSPQSPPCSQLSWIKFPKPALDFPDPCNQTPTCRVPFHSKILFWFSREKKREKKLVRVRVSRRHREREIMSFRDLEAGRPLASRRDRVNGKQDSTQAVASGIFQINTAVSTFQRLVNTLGTPKDTPELREKLSVPLSRFFLYEFWFKKNLILAYRLNYGEFCCLVELKFLSSNVGGEMNSWFWNLSYGLWTGYII